MGPNGASGNDAFPTKAPRSSPTYNWNGFYVGINAGYGVGWNNYRHDEVGLITEQLAVSPVGGLAGGQVGFNWLFAPNLLAGVEADWQWADQRHSSCTDLCTPTASTVLPAEEYNVNQKISSPSTARVRVGYTKAEWLFYATVGAAWARVSENVSILENTFTTNADFGQQTRAGLAAGAGTEVALGANLSAKFEYLYANLGSWSEMTGPVVFSNLAGGIGAPQVIHEHLQDHIVRVGLDYHLGH